MLDVTLDVNTACYQAVFFLGSVLLFPPRRGVSLAREHPKHSPQLICGPLQATCRPGIQQAWEGAQVTATGWDQVGGGFKSTGWLASQEHTYKQA